ncbi:unnamed protein product [Auanema sp. JU1783]|nr:unnamed protein product [Auanema sp. JU1783]
MFSFLSRLGSPSTSSPGREESSRSESPKNEQGWNAAFASDPSQWESNFDSCWKEANAILELKERNPEREITYDQMAQLLKQLSHMCKLLMMEANAQPEPAIGPILDRYFTQEIMERVLHFAIQIPDFIKAACQLSLIRIYEEIVSESHTQNHCLLVHKPILHPLLRLFDWCKRDELLHPSNHTQLTSRDKHFVILLHQICAKLAEDRTLLHFFFSCADGANQFAVFSLLIPFLYEQNDTGQLARDALLRILSVSSQHEQIAEFVSKKSAFCPVVATGLSGCFSQLPRILSVEGGDRLVPDHFNEFLTNFHSSIVFCNAVVQAAHPYVVEQICSFFYSGFLISVVKPALLQEEREAVAASTAYLQVCIDAISEAKLIKMIIRMLLVEKDDDNNILLNIIVNRIRGTDRLALTSLQLLDCLLQLGCEDLMLFLTFRYLLSLPHVSKNQLQLLRDAKHVSDLADEFLACIPDMMLSFPEISSQNTLQVYLREGAQIVEKRAYSSSSWKWKYDGVHPSYLSFREDSDDDAHNSFSRLNSCRSSMSSAAHGLNRYFASRSFHLTADSTTPYSGRLVGLGESPTGLGSLEDITDEVQEDSEFVLPPIHTSSIMTSSMVDYFQFAAFDDTSDSEESPGSPGRKEKSKCKMDSVSLDSENDSNGEKRTYDPDVEMAKSFVLTGWSTLDDEAFIAMIDSQSLTKDAANTSITEFNSYLDSRLQYWNELDQGKDDNTVQTADDAPAEPEMKPDVTGRLVQEAKGIPFVIECLLGELERMSEHSLLYNLSLASTIASLAAYPQPILAILFFGKNVSDEYPSLLKKLANLKERLDHQTASVESLNTWVTRSLKTLNARAERVDRWADGSRYGESPREDSVPQIPAFLRGKTFGASGRRNPIRYHMHKAAEPLETVRDDERTKNLVHAAIVHSNLCQFLAGIAMHQSIAVVCNRASSS